MTFIEVFVPKGVLTDDQRRTVCERLITELISAPGAPADLIERGRALTTAVVHEPDAWAVGGRSVEAADAPRYVVRVSLTGGHLSAATRTETVERVTRVLAEVAPDPDRLYREPHAAVQILEVPDGNMGLFGRIVSTAELVKMVVNPEGAVTVAPTASEQPRPSSGQSPQSVIDPICGMTVVLDATAITLERDGRTYGFCNQACRDIFASQH